MKKISEYKWWLIIGLLILPITFILLVTIIGMVINFIKYSDFNFNLIRYWNNSFSNLYISLLAILLSLVNYLYYACKICFAKKQKIGLRASKQNDYGSAKWLSKKEINQLYPLVSIEDAFNQHGFVVNSKLIKNKLFYNLKTNTHSLVLGGTGSGKTQGIVLPTISINAKSQIKPSMVITDVKGELYQSQTNLLKEQGYDVKILNLRNIRESIAWNPLQSVYNQFKLMLFTTNQQEKLYLKVQIQTDIQELSKTLFVNKKQADPFWNDSGALITEAIILGILENTEALVTKENAKNSKIIGQLLDKYLPVRQFNLASVAIIASLGKGMNEWFKGFPDTSIAKITANQVLQSGLKTLASILMTMSTNLALFKNEFIRNLTCNNDLNFIDFINKPIALFIVVPDENQNYYVFISLLISQLYKYLVIQANKNQGAKLVRPVYFLCDEFANLPVISNIETMITISRSRNIFFQLILQDLQQLKERYSAEIANIIFTNCSLHLFLQTMDLNTAEKYSKMIGEATVVQISTSVSNATKSQSETLKGHSLILASDLMKLSTNQAIVFYAKENPFKANLTPWHQINSYKPLLVDNKKKKINLINFQKDYYYDIKIQYFDS
ncbi:MAG: VirD4-like conjugal transfer protein, CD1115 family [Spiroplasma sp.]